MKLQLKGEVWAMAGNRLAPLAQWLAAFFIMGCFGVVISGYTPTQAVPQSERLSSVRAAVPIGWNVINERTVDKWTIKGEILTAKSPFIAQDSEKIVEERAISQGYKLMSSSGNGGRRRLIFCKESLSLDIEIVATDPGSIAYFGVYWAAQKTDSRFCRS
ncbi:hypothetical protein [[Pseudomonas] boreopolis]|uniref:hypothetical protein n=1 Tax=Xanthomonas boreopolis TaxID=86183 RepID=UPI003D9BAAA3